MQTTQNVEICFLTKHPHTTYWLEVAYPADETPAELLAALAEIGWSAEGGPQAPPLEERMELWLEGPAGSDLFGGWTAAEREQQVAAVEAALAPFGFTEIECYEADEELR